jgi:hypothetical protein
MSSRSFVRGLALFASASVLLAFACSSNGSVIGTSQGSAVSGNLPCDVAAVLQKNCQTCHGAVPAGAPMSLVTLGDLLAPSPTDGHTPVYQMVATRTHAKTNWMPQGKPHLAAKDQKVLDDWIAGGAEGVPDQCSGSVATADEQLNCDETAGEVLQSITPPSDIDLKTTADVPDQYTCFGFDLPYAGEKMHITKLYPHIDKRKYLHHMLLYRLDDKDFQALSKKPFVCPGAPGGDGRDTSGWRLVTGWEPGGAVTTLPDAAGFPEEPFPGDPKTSTHWVLEIHYSNPKADQGVIDKTGYDLCATKKLRKFDADVMRFGTEHFRIPPRTSMTTMCNWTVPHLADFDKPGVEGLHVFSATAHMHNTGREIFVSSSAGDVLANTSFDYKNQSAVDANVVLKAGDTTGTVCRWENTTDRSLSYGELTGQSEMCYVYASYYPKIEDPTWNWNAPAAAETQDPDKDPRCGPWQLYH